MTDPGHGLGGDAVRDRFRGCLLGLAVGDALGAPFEGRPQVPAGEVDEWAQSRAALRWTDDTAMTIGVAESLVACEGFDGAHMAAVLAEAYAAEPWRGYGAGPPQVFAALARGLAWDEAAAGLFGGQGSHGNGGAMRAAPVGLVAADREDAARIACAQARITHAHPLGQQGAAVQAVAVAWAVKASEGADPGEVLEEVRRVDTASPLRETLDRLSTIATDAPPREVAAVLGHGVAAAEAVPAALHAFLRHPRSFPGVVHDAIALGGDTDTIASMAGAVSGALLGADAIPAAWRQRLEGADRLVTLADALHALRPPRGEE